jgi:hypothetical protein
VQCGILATYCKTMNIFIPLLFHTFARYRGIPNIVFVQNKILPKYYPSEIIQHGRGYHCARA